MIYFFIGTKAQFIKMAPVMVELNNRQIPYKYVDSGQHAELTRVLRNTFGIRAPDVYLRQGSDITSIFAAVKWALKLIFMALFAKNKIKREIFPEDGICLIHGDTLSTLLGLKMAKAAGLKVGHVEAGLRSFNIFHPFPEELIRIYCMKRCDILFVPSRIAYDNLQRMKVKGKIVQVDGNTVVDSLRLMQNVPATIDIPVEPFALAACHRLETITRRKKLEKVVQLLNEVAKTIKVIFVTHKPTRKYLERFNLLGILSGNIELLDMQDYMNFTALMKSAKIVIADGGSIQEECAYLNKPCLIIRHKTERPDGIGKNAMLWNFDGKNADLFMKRYNEYDGGRQVLHLNPSKKIVDVLIDRNTV